MTRRLQILPYEPAAARAWDELVAASINGTVFHSRRFLAYHPPGRFDEAGLLVRDGGKLVAVIPAAWRDDDELGRVHESHPGASYGGPVLAPGASGRLVHDVVAAWVEHARAAGATALRTRLPPVVFHRRPLAELELSLSYAGFALCRRELSSYLRLDAEADPYRVLAGRGRNQVRQGERSGLRAGCSEDLAQYWDILADNLRRAHGVAPTHRREELERLRDLLGEDLRLFVAADGDRIEAGTLVLRCNAHSAHTFYMAARRESQPRRALNLALFAAIRWAHGAGLRVLNLGVSTPQGRSVNWGLLKFKEGMGGVGVCRDTYLLRL